MNSSFYNGVSGIKTQQFAMDVQANNIANINNSGFKGSTPEVSTLFSTTLTGAYFALANDRGLGSQSQTTALNLEQGVLENTDSPFDLAIQGEGWFGVQGQNGKTYYTRAGSFSMDAAGSLVDANGNYLMATSGNNITPTTLDAATLAHFGTYYKAATSAPAIPYAIAATDNVPLGSVGAQTKVTLPDFLYYPPIATSKVSYGANLDPTIKTDSVVVPLNAADYTATVTPTAFASLNGTVSNTAALLNPQAGDAVTVTLTDIDGKTQNILTTLDASLNWSITNEDISGLNITSDLTASVAATYAPVAVTLNAADYTAAVIPTGLGKASLSGTVSNTTALQNPKEGDTVTITLTDIDGKTLNIATQLDASKSWSIAGYDVSSLNITSDLTASVTVKSTQEIANVEHYTTGIIAPDGTKDIIDMTFTKQVPQAASGSVWDAQIKILSYFEDYTVENYDSTKTYDTSIYTVNTVKGTVTKIYDPTKYYVDTATNKVYDIVDTQTGALSFGGAGQLLSNSVPALSNGGSPLTLNLGTAGGYDGLISSTTIKKANVVTSDGSVEGFLKDYAMDGNGNVVAEFSNGKSSAIAKVAIYHFQNDQGLSQTSSTLFEESSNSGKAIFYTKNGESFLGSQIFSNKLEGSNVSMATALTELIVIQKAFDASSKSITTSDELLQNAINMKK